MVIGLPSLSDISKRLTPFSSPFFKGSGVMAFKPYASFSAVSHDVFPFSLSADTIITSASDGISVVNSSKSLYFCK